MNAPRLSTRLASHGLESDSWVIRRIADRSIVAYLSPSDAAALADRLDRGMSLELALRAIRALSFRSLAS